VTLILTTGLSILYFVKRLFSDGEDFGEEFEDDEEEEAEEKPVAKKPVAAKKPAAATAKAPAKRKPRKKKDSENAEEVTEAVEADGGTEIASEDGQAEEGVDDANKVYEFQPLVPATGSYPFPTTRLLKNAPSVKALSKGQLRENAAKIVEHLLSFQIT